MKLLLEIIRNNKQLKAIKKSLKAIKINKCYWRNSEISAVSDTVGLYCIWSVRMGLLVLILYIKASKIK